MSLKKNKIENQVNEFVRLLHKRLKAHAKDAENSPNISREFLDNTSLIVVITIGASQVISVSDNNFVRAASDMESCYKQLKLLAESSAKNSIH